MIRESSLVIRYQVTSAKKLRERPERVEKRLAGAEDDDGFAVGRDQAIFLEGFHDPSGHLA